MPLIGRDEDLRILSGYMKRAKTVSKRNVVRDKMRRILSEADDRTIAKLRSCLIFQEKKDNSRSATAARNQIMLYLNRNRIH